MDIEDPPPVSLRRKHRNRLGVADHLVPGQSCREDRQLAAFPAVTVALFFVDEIFFVDALVRTFKKTEIESLEKSPVSLMPADLNKVLTVQDLADVVEYMLLLKEAQKGKK